MKNKSYRFLSLLLSILVLATACICPTVANAGVGNTPPNDKVRDYYVKYDGTEYADTDVYGTNGTVENPYKTVYDVVAAVKADATFNTAANTFNVWIMQDIEAVANMNANVKVGSTTYATHNMVSWAKAGTTATMSSYKAKMVVKPYANNAGTTYLAFSTLAGAVEQMQINGPTEFDNIKLVMTANDYNGNLVNGRINCNGNNVKFGSGVTYAYVNTAKSEAASWDGTITNIATITTDIVDVHDSDTVKVIEDAFEVEFENVINGTKGYTGFPTVKGDANYNFKNDVTIAITGAPYQGRLSLGGDGNKYASVLDKNLNLRLTGSTETFQFAKNSSLIVKGGVQVIKSGSFKGSNVSYASISGFNLYATEEKAAKAPVWFINVDKSVKNHIDFVDGVTGKFQVPANAVAVATDAEGKTYTSDKNGILDLSEKAGEYTVSITIRTYDYYVKGGATGTGMSGDDPAPSIATAVTNMVASGGLTAEDTANIWIMQDMTDITGTGAKNGGTHNMAYWGTLPAFTNTIHIKPHKDNTYTGNVTSTLLDMGDGNINKQSSCTFTGDTIVEGVKFVRTSASNLTTADSATLFFNGNNVTLGKGVTFAYINANGNTTHPTGSDKAGQKFSSAGWPTNLTYLLKEHMHFFTTTVVSGEEYSEPIKIAYNNDFDGAAVGQRLDVPATVTGTYTFKDDVTVEFSGAASQASLRLGTSASDATIKYESDLNLKFSKASTGLRLMKGKSKMIVKGGVQILAETGFNLASNSDAASLYALGLLYKEDGTTPADMWYINVPASLDKIDFTSKTGVYKIADNFIATATNKTTGATKESKNGVLDLSEAPGEYTVTFTKEDYNYYVGYGGTGDGTDINNPAPNVATAVTTMNTVDGLAEGDTANIWIVQDIAATAKKGTKTISDKTYAVHNMAYWGTVPAHTAKIVVKPHEDNQKNNSSLKTTYLAFVEIAGKNAQMSVSGPTVFEDIKLVYCSSSNTSNVDDGRIILKGNDVKFGSGVTYGYTPVNSDNASTWAGAITEIKTLTTNIIGTHTTEKVFEKSIDIEFANAVDGTIGYIFLPSRDASYTTFEKDVTISFTGASTSGRLRIGHSSNTYPVVFKQNLNFKVTDGYSFGFNKQGKVTVLGAVQLIKTKALSFSDANFYSNSYKADGTTLADKWELTVKNGQEGLIDFIDGKKGEFAINSDYVATATNTKTSETKDSKNGVLDLSEAPGEYTVTFKEKDITPEPEPKPQTEPQMLYIKAKEGGPIQQRVTVTPGETYTYSFSLSNTIPLKNIKVGAFHVDNRSTPIATGVMKSIDTETSGRYTIYTYEIKMPEAMTDKDGKSTNNTFVGVQFVGGSSYEGYLFNASLYKKSDASKKEILENGDFLNTYLDKWTWGWTDFRSEVDLGKKEYTSDDGKVNIKVLKFDETLMPEIELEMPNTEPQMLYIKAKEGGPIQQRVNVTPGETYVYSFSLSNTISLNNIKVGAFHVDNRSTRIATGVMKSKDTETSGIYTIYTYEIKMPEIMTDKDGKSTSNTFVGVQFVGDSSYEGYLFKASLYKKSDASKKEILENGDFLNTYLDKWTWGWTDFRSEVDLGKKEYTSDDGKVNIKVLKFDESKMADDAANFPPKVPHMLHIVTDHAGPLGQLVSAKAGEKYTFEVAISNNVSFDVAVNHGDSRHAAINAKVDYVNCVDKGKYAVWTYTITMPDDLSAKTVLLGIKFKGPKPYDCYLTDAYLYNNADTTKENLFTNNNFAKGELDGWKWKYENDTSGKSVFEEKFSDGEDSQKNPLYYNVKLEVMDFDESKMEKASAIKPDYSRKMIYFKNGAITQALSSWVDCKPGDKFIVSYSIFATDEVVPHFNRNGLRGNVNGNPELLSEVKTEIKPGYNYTTYTYRVTVPETYEDKLIFLGLKMPFYVEGYVFDIECYREGDANKKSAWRNGDFVYGLNDWIWGWTVTWFTQEGNQLKEWSDGMNEIKFVPFDLNQIVLLVDEINRDDGEWWKPTDIIEAEEEEQGIATIKGTFTDQDGKPIDKVKLILKSDNKTYTTFTDKKGAFVFKDIVADYYELYYVNSKGEEVSTSFSYGLSNGDTVTLKIVSDTTKRSKGAVSALKGTVYTASLETVSNLKVCLRGFGETVTDKDGNFSFVDVPVGMYELYTILEDGTEYVFRTVEIKENIDLGVKLKYDPQTAQAGSNQDLSFWIWIIIGCGAVVLVSGGLVTTLLILKKKRMVI